jgi:phosphatidylserine/phosphatidylglycerophosphate/cardiolipin synthase-like enzyme
MDDIIDYLRVTIGDEVLSKSEKKSLKQLLIERPPLDDHQLNFLRSKIYELANEKVTPENYRFILEWVRNVNNALVSQADSGSVSDAYFSPGETCRNVIINQLNNAIKQVQICVFTISDDSITKAIIGSHKRGTEIKIITDNDKSLDEGSDIRQISKEGIPVKMDRTSNHMHHKFMVVDGKAVITGSYNWTLSAARYNHENILLTREAGVVKSYLKEFEQLWRMMADY